jgi:citrate/tricarballylate utilization protein
MRLTDVMAEGDRILTICNACRYCEGYCAVFPAMERRLTFAAGDLDYLANLCHNCGECYYACQYAPPHEFAVNVPQTLAQIRGTTWRRHAWPQAFAKLYDANGLATSLLLVLSLIVLMLAVRSGAAFYAPASPGDFYAVMSHGTMAAIFSIAALYVVVALVIGYRSFCRDVGEPLREMANPAARTEALRDVFSLRYLHGGGAGCRHPDEASATARRVFHHFTFYGFLLCFAATVVGTVYHYGFGWRAPYALTSLPVMLGTLGGIGLVVGPLGFLWLRSRRERDTSDEDQLRLNSVFTVMLLLTSVTGLALLGYRETSAIGLLLVVHLAFVLTLFLTLPYGKFVHALYRFAALTRYALERKRPGLNVGGE